MARGHLGLLEIDKRLSCFFDSTKRFDFGVSMIMALWQWVQYNTPLVLANDPENDVLGLSARRLGPTLGMLIT